jgi:hypothetical protein
MKAALELNRERLDALPLYVNIMGLKIGDEVALIDAGFGERHPNPNFGWLAEGLRQLGIKPEQVTTGFLGWIETRLDIEDPERRAATAGLILATVDGLALLEIGAGAPAALAAAERARDVRFTP